MAFTAQMAHMAYMAYKAYLAEVGVVKTAVVGLSLVLSSVLVMAAMSRRRHRPPLASGAGWADVGWPLVGSLRFFSARGDYFLQGQRQSSNGYFSFFCGGHSVVALSGEAGRKSFYSTRGLDLNAGFRALYSIGPDLNDIVGRGASSYFRQLFKRFAAAESLASALSYIHRDIQASYEGIAAGGVPVDPFQSMYPLVYQLTHRTLGCHDIADDPGLVAKTLAFFDTLDTYTAIQIIFPSLPTLHGLRKLIAGTRMHFLLTKIVAERKKTGRSRDDAMQVMIDHDDSDVAISMFIMGGLFAGFFNTGFLSSWILSYLAHEKHWQTEMRAEVDAAVAKHRATSDETAIDVLQRLSVSDWEADFPLIQLALRETIRLRLPGFTVRRNITGDALALGETGVVVPKNGFTMYALADAHLDGSIYSDATKWDPSRFLPNRAEDKKVPHAFIGWGSGTSPCLGVKLATLEVTILMATFLATFEFSLSDKKGNAVSQLPAIDRNELQPKQMLGAVYLKCKPRNKQ